MMTIRSWILVYFLLKKVKEKHFLRIFSVKNQKKILLKKQKENKFTKSFQLKASEENFAKKVKEKNLYGIFRE